MAQHACIKKTSKTCLQIVDINDLAVAYGIFRLHVPLQICFASSLAIMLRECLHFSEFWAGLRWHPNMVLHQEPFALQHWNHTIKFNNFLNIFLISNIGIQSFSSIWSLISHTRTIITDENPLRWPKDAGFWFLDLIYLAGH